MTILEYESCFYKERLNNQIIYLLKGKNNLSEDNAKKLLNLAKQGQPVNDSLLTLLKEIDFGGHFTPQQYIEGCIRDAKASLISERELQWLKKQRATSFIFDTLHHSYRIFFSNKPSLLSVVLPADIFELKGERMTYESAVRIIDMLSLASNTRETQSLLNDKKNKWESVIKKFNNPFWFPDNRTVGSYSDDYQWVFDYFQKHEMTKGNVELFNYSLPHLIIFSAFDQWAAERTNSETELFILKLKKAWGQKKYRDSVKDKKVLNTYISKESKKQLDYLVKKNKIKINEQLEILIHDAYMKEAIKY